MVYKEKWTQSSSKYSPVYTCSNTSENVKFRKNTEKGVSQSGGSYMNEIWKGDE